MKLFSGVLIAFAVIGLSSSSYANTVKVDGGTYSIDGNAVRASFENVSGCTVTSVKSDQKLQSLAVMRRGEYRLAIQLTDGTTKLQKLPKAQDSSSLKQCPSFKKLGRSTIQSSGKKDIKVESLETIERANKNKYSLIVLSKRANNGNVYFLNPNGSTKLVYNGSSGQGQAVAVDHNECFEKQGTGYKDAIALVRTSQNKILFVTEEGELKKTKKGAVNVQSLGKSLIDIDAFRTKNNITCKN